MTKRTKGICLFCGKTCAVKADGRLFHHLTTINGERVTCEGSYNVPLGDPRCYRIITRQIELARLRLMALPEIIANEKEQLKISHGDQLIQEQIHKLELELESLPIEIKRWQKLFKM